MLASDAIQSASFFSSYGEQGGARGLYPDLHGFIGSEGNLPPGQYALLLLQTERHLDIYYYYKLYMP